LLFVEFFFGSAINFPLAFIPNAFSFALGRDCLFAS